MMRFSSSTADEKQMGKESAAGEADVGGEDEDDDNDDNEEAGTVEWHPGVKMWGREITSAASHLHRKERGLWCKVCVRCEV